jgi:hypothetical protein
MKSWKIKKRDRKAMDSNDAFYREIDARLERTLEEIEHHGNHDVSSGQSKPAVGHPGASKRQRNE